MGQLNAYTYKINSVNTNYDYTLQYLSSIADMFLKSDAETYISNAFQLNYGIGSSYKINTPGLNIEIGKNDKQAIDTIIGNSNYKSIDNHAYLQGIYTVNNKLKLNAGIRTEYYIQKKYKPVFIQPRVNCIYNLNNRTSLKVGYSLMNQNIHLLTNSGTGLPTDLWLPATQTAPSELSNQISMGVSKDILTHYEFSFESYYKTFNNLIDYKEGASYLNTFSSWENKIVIGKGKAYGAEFFIHKKQGKYNGWISYTLSYTNRQFNEINQGLPFPFRYDRRHIANIVLNYELKKDERRVKEFSISWSYLSGYAVTLPTKLYDYSIAPENAYLYIMSSSSIFEDASIGNAYGILSASSKNNYRMRASHHLDVSYSITKIKKWGERKITFSIYNIYARSNPYYIYAGNYVQNFQFRTGYFEKSILLFIPSISVQYSF